MGLSFHNEATISEFSAGTEMRFGPGDADSTLEVGRIVHQEHETQERMWHRWLSRKWLCWGKRGMTLWFWDSALENDAFIVSHLLAVVARQRYREPLTIMDHIYYHSERGSASILVRFPPSRHPIMGGSGSTNAEPVCRIPCGFNWKTMLKDQNYLNFWYIYEN